tara:strand:- start:80 stop:412 length:333 start_codon:yes stop_codon:yes gene_type:complete
MAFKMRTPFACWTKAGYIRKPGTEKGEPGSCYKPSPNKATRKVCLPKAKIARMSEAEKQKVIRAKHAAADQGKTRRASSSNVTGTSSKNLKDWVKQDWRQVANPSKKCGE